MKQTLLVAVCVLSLGCGIGSKPGTFGGGALTPISLLGDVQIVDRLEGDYYKEGSISEDVHRKVRFFVAIAEPTLQAMINGATTVETVQAALNAMTLEPGVLLMVRDALNQAITDHGMGISPWLVVRDAYLAMWGGIAIDGSKHPDLVKALFVINAIIAAIPGDIHV